MLLKIWSLTLIKTMALQYAPAVGSAIVGATGETRNRLRTLKDLNVPRLTRYLLPMALSFALTTATAALHDRGQGMIYDDVLGITWLKDANLAMTSGHDLDGLMSHSEAISWVGNLLFGGFDDWRLPTIYTDTSICNSNNWTYGGGDCGFNVRTVVGGNVVSEMAHMYYGNLGFKPYLDADGIGIPRPDWGIFGNGTSNGLDNANFGQRNIGLFENVQAFMYGLSETNESGNHRWVFFIQHGEQSMVGSGSEAFAWAVRDGDVLAVLSPSTVALMVAALGQLYFIGRYRLRHMDVKCGIYRGS